jgi:SRSO17 transposase
MVEVGVAEQAFGELMALVGRCFVRIEPRLQAVKYVAAVMSELPERNGWTIAEYVGDATPDRTQRLLNHANWDTGGAMAAIRRFVVERLDRVAPASSLRIGALDETGQQKQGEATSGVKRQYMGCAGRVANGVNTVHLAYVRGGLGHCLIGARQWVPAAQINDPVQSLRTGLPLDLEFRTKGELAIAVVSDAFADGLVLDFVCGDEVYGNCTRLRAFLEGHAQGYVLRVASNFHLDLGAGTVLTCAQIVKKHLKQKRRWTIASAGTGSKGERNYAWAWVATADPRHHLLVRKHLKTGEHAFHYCYVPDGKPATLKRLVTAAGLRWPVEECFEFGKDLFGLDQSQVRLYTAIARHTVLVMAALAICAVTAAAAKRRTDTQTPPPTSPEDLPPKDPGLIPLTIAEIKHLLNASIAQPRSLQHAAEWSTWRRRHQARARWFHRRARLAASAQLTL